MKKKRLRTLSWILLLIGCLLLAILGIVSTWGDIEATVFNSAIKSKKPLSSLRCPALITPKDDAFVSARIENPSDRDLEMEIRTRVSDGYVFLMKEFTTNFELKSGESEVIHIPISVTDAAYDRFVLVRMHQISRGPLPYLNASCGVMVINLTLLTGKQFIIIVISLGLLLSAAGLILWIRNVEPEEFEQRKIQKFLIFYIILSLIVCITGLLALWLLAVLFIIIWILLGIGKASQLLLWDIENY